MGPLQAWLLLGLASAFVGLVCGWLAQGRPAVLIGGAVPWLGFLGLVLYDAYLGPYEGGGASMWPIAQLVGGTFAAVVGASMAAGVQKFLRS